MTQLQETHVLFVVLLAVSGLLAISVVPVAAQSDDWPDEDYRQVSLGDHSGTVSSDTDADRFKIPVSKGQVIETSLSKQAGDAVEASVFLPGGGFYTLSNDGGTDDTQELTVTEDGYVQVEVEGETDGSGLPWTVAVTDTGVSDEWNNEAYEQVSLGTYEGAVNSWNDRDRFRIPVSKGDVLETSLSKEAGDDVEAGIAFPGGAFTLTNDGGTDDTRELTVQEDGFVEVEVEKPDLDEMDGEDFPWSVTIADTGVRDEWNDEAYEQVSAGTYEGAISSWDDRDRFRIPVSKGQVIETSLSKEAGDELEAGIAFPGGAFTLANNGGTGDTQELTVTEDGFVEVEVEPPDLDELDGNDLPWSISVQDTGVRDEWNSGEYEQVSLGTHEGAVNSWNDRDQFKIPVSAGTVITTTLSKEAGDNVGAQVSYPHGAYSLADVGGTRDSREITFEQDGFVEVEIGNPDFSGMNGEDFPWSVTVQEGRQPTPTPTTTPTATQTPTETATPTPTPTVTPTPTATPAPTPTATPRLETPSQTATPTDSPTRDTQTHSRTATPPPQTESPSQTPTPSPVQPSSETATPSQTRSPLPETVTPSSATATTQAPPAGTPTDVGSGGSGGAQLPSSQGPGFGIVVTVVALLVVALLTSRRP